MTGALWPGWRRPRKIARIALDGQRRFQRWRHVAAPVERARMNLNATPAFDGERVYVSINRGTGLCGVWVTSTICCLDANSGALL